jgi:hypothetical protein
MIIAGGGALNARAELQAEQATGRAAVHQRRR